MNRVAAATVIKGNGKCEVFMNGVVMKEMKRLNEQHDAEMRSKNFELDTVRRSRDMLRADNLKTRVEKRSRWQCIKESICEKVLVVWACIFLAALKLKLIEEVKEDEK